MRKNINDYTLFKLNYNNNYCGPSMEMSYNPSNDSGETYYHQEHSIVVGTLDSLLFLH